MNLKKILSVVIALGMIFTILPNYHTIKASEVTNGEEELIAEELVEELTEEFSEIEDNELTINSINADTDSLEVEIELNTDDYEMNMAIEVDDSAEMDISGKVVTEDGQTINQDYHVTVEKSLDDIFIATFVDKKSGEVYNVNTTELQASALPLIPILIVVARVAAPKVIKYGSKIFKKAPASAVTNALKNFTTATYKSGSHTFKLTKTDMKHMLERHHPKYWNGTAKSTQTFYNPNLSVNQVKDIAISIAKQNSKTLSSKGTNSTFQVEGKVNGVKYVLGIQKGHIHQLYPVY